MYTTSPRKSVRRTSVQLQISHSTIHGVLHKSLRLYACKVQLLQTLKPEDKLRPKDFAVSMLDRLDSDPVFLKRVCFSNELTFHSIGCKTDTMRGHGVRRPLTKPRNYSGTPLKVNKCVVYK